MTDRFIFFFNEGKKLKKLIKIRNIIKIKHSENNNYICLESRDMSNEILETFKKEEIILYLNRKMRK